MQRRQFLKAISGLTSTWFLSQQRVLAETVVQRTIRCPILMYHYVSPLPPNSDRYRTDLTMSPDMFIQHCTFLVANGYTTISMAQLAEALFEGSSLPDKPVVLTFDDGYADAYDYVLPILQQHGMVGTFFIVGHFMDSPGHLTWGQAGVLLEAGMEVENHTMSHPDLRNRDDAYLRQQIGGAADAIEVTFLKRPRFFCYPAGRYDWNTIRIVRETGHQLAVTTQDSLLHSSSYPYRLGRLRIRRTTGVNALNWLISR